MAEPTPTPIGELARRTRATFLTMNLITQACEGILNINFTEPPGKPDWFPGLNNELEEAKKVARTWVNTLAPSITAGAPALVVNYEPIFKATSTKIETIAKEYPDAQGPDDPHVKQIQVYISELLGELGTILREAETTNAGLASWADEIEDAHTKLSSGAATIQNAETQLHAEITKMEGALAVLKAEIAAENAALVNSELAVAGGVFLGVAGIALTLGTGPWGLVVVGIGATLVIGGAVEWSKFQKKLNEHFDEVSADQSELSADEAAVVALEGLSAASSQATGYASDASRELSRLRTQWKGFEDELKGVQRTLDRAEAKLSVAVQGTLDAAAKEEWEKAAELAQHQFDSQVTVETGSFSIFKSSARAA